MAQAQDLSAHLSPLLAEKTARFCRTLRARGYTIGVQETLDAVRVAGGLIASDFPAFRAGLRNLCVVSREQWQDFDRLFDAYWLPAPADPGPPPSPGRSQEERMPAAYRVAGYTETENDAVDEEEELAPSGASAAEVLRQTDLSLVTGPELAQLERLALRLWRQMSLRLARRIRGRYQKSRIDIRRTLRRNLSRGGDPWELVPRGRKRRKPGLVLLLDVSGSMNPYSVFFLKLTYVMQRHFRRVFSFAFSTRLVDIGPLLATRKLPEALALLSAATLGWGGGTQIGESIAALNREHGERVGRSKPFVIVLSDGWDVGDADLLHDELRAMKRWARKLIWLNPLAGSEGYQPLTKGIQAALPLIDVFAPAHNLNSLLDIERFLVG